MEDDVMNEDAYEWGTAGTFLVVCTGVGDTVSQSKENAYKVVKGVKVGNDSGYRLDIGDKVKGFLKELHKYGFANKLKF
jgi:phosphoribosylamine-glycine ligase